MLIREVLNGKRATQLKTNSERMLNALKLLPPPPPPPPNLPPTLRKSRSPLFDEKARKNRMVGFST